MKNIILILTALLLISKLSFAQITVTPATIHLSDSHKSGYILIRNNSKTIPQEVSTEIKFGYPKSDTTGKTIMYFPENLNESDPSIIKWVSFYPRKFVLQPLKEQVVRITVKPSKLSGGEYWGRPIIISRPAIKKSNSGKVKVATKFGVEFRTVLALYYREGKVNTKINFKQLSGEYQDNKFVLMAKLKRVGNAAYIGNLLVNISDGRGNYIKEIKQKISVYYELNKRIVVETGKLKKGYYTIEVKLNTNREESEGKIINGNSVTKKIVLKIK